MARALRPPRAEERMTPGTRLSPRALALALAALASIAAASRAQDAAFSVDPGVSTLTCCSLSSVRSGLSTSRVSCPIVISRETSASIASSPTRYLKLLSWR